MLKNLFNLLKRVYNDCEFELYEKASLIWDHGVFIEALKSDDIYLLIYSLDKAFHYKFATIQLNFKNQKIEKILFLDKLEVHQYLPEHILQKALKSGRMPDQQFS